MKSIRSLKITDYLKERHFATLAELMERFEVSSATIHRDVAELLRLGVVERVRGGVAFSETSPFRPEIGVRRVAASGYAERANLHHSAKAKIAKRAVALVTEGDILFLDSSTTASFFAEELTHSNFSALTLITNSLAIMEIFSKFPSHYVLIGLGGSYDPQLNGLLGQSTLRELDRLTITKAFVSCFGLDDKIATTNHENQAALVSRVLELSTHRYLLADKSKLNRKGLYRLSSRGSFDAIITAR